MFLSSLNNRGYVFYLLENDLYCKYTKRILHALQ